MKTNHNLKNLHINTPELSIYKSEKWGIQYNSNRVLPFIHFNKYDKYVDVLSKDLIPGGRTILVLASGTDNELIERFKNLDYQNIILVDYMFDNYLCINHLDKKIICVNLDAYICIQVLLQIQNFGVNAIVSLNVGVQGGGANMCIATNALGLLFPIMSDEVIIITSLEYYKRSQVYKFKKSNWLNLPYESKKILKPADNYYIDPNIFTTHKFMQEIGGEVVILTNKINRTHTFVRSNITVKVSHTSIFNFELSDTKTIGVMKFENLFQEAIFRNNYPNLVSWNGAYYTNKQFNKQTIGRKTYYLSDLFQFNLLLKEYDIQTLILTPIGGDYLELIDRIAEMDNNIKTIIFTHLNHGDYSLLYNCK